MNARPFSLGFAVLLALSAPAVAQPGNVCRPDAERLCSSQVAARDREGAKACLMKNLDKLSDACRARIKQAMDKSPPKGT